MSDLALLLPWLTGRIPFCANAEEEG